MDSSQLLEKVKEILMITENSFNSVLLPRLLAVKDYMKNAGVSDELVISDMGIVALALGVNDLWNLNSGGQEFSKGFMNMVTQLQLKSME